MDNKIGCVFAPIYARGVINKLIPFSARRTRELIRITGIDSLTARLKFLKIIAAITFISFIAKFCPMQFLEDRTIKILKHAGTINNCFDFFPISK